MRILTCLFEQHDLLLVGLAAAICVIGALVTIRLFRRVRAVGAEGRSAWTFLGALAGGATIWCTHFVAMLAYRPGVEVTYDPMLTAVSLVVAVVGCAIALTVAALKARGAAEVGGMTFGLAVTAMHYLGMDAFAADATVHWSLVYVAGSVLAAVIGGGVAFRLAAHPQVKRPIVFGALTLVVTIVALHFTGMGAMTVIPFAPVQGAITGADAAPMLALGVAAIGFLILGTAIASHALEDSSERQGAKRMRQLIESSVDGMLVEADGKIVIANAAFARLCGLAEAEVTDSLVSHWIENADGIDDSVLTQSRLMAHDGSAIPVEVAVRIETGDDGQTFRVFAIRDLRARLDQERRIAHLALNDSLTGLPNRTSFLDTLERAAAGGERFALLALDLDGFKEINDLYGHAAGDRMLVQVAERLSRALEPGEFVARLGGDEFAVIAPVTERLQALGVAERLRAAVARPIHAGPQDLQAGAAVGIAIWPDNARELSALINDADLAMHRAKGALAAGVCFYEEAMDEAVRNRRRVTQGLREALENDAFELHYQVQASIQTGQVTGYEVLLRWRHEDGQYVSPAEFVPIAEDTGLILPIGEWVLRRACAEAAAWDQPHRIAVNLSPIQLAHTDLPRLVHQILIETGLKPSRLELEITETAMMTDMDRTIHVLRHLKLLGVSLAMDDFGAGYSSLSTLGAFPFDKIKLDRSFMTELESGPQSKAIIRAVLALGESLSIPVLAEGVETQVQLDFLRTHGCDEVQGYLLGRPSPDRLSPPAVPAQPAAPQAAPRAA